MKLQLVTGIVLLSCLCYERTAGVEIGELPNIQHGISGQFHVYDSKTIGITDFNYDGQGPDAWFFYFEPGVTAKSSGENGHKIYLPPQYGQSDGRLKGQTYTDVDVIVTLPDGVDACDIGTFTIWCELFAVFFTKIEIPTSIFENNGEGTCALFSNDTNNSSSEVVVTPPPPEFDNCAVFDDKLQLSWRVHSDQSNVRFRLCGCQSLVSTTNQYMGFGMSGSTTGTQMQGADPTIAWVDPVDGPQAVDYYLSAYTQCRDGMGACPDELDSSGTCTNDVFDIEGSVTDGVQCVSFTRNFTTTDSTCDTAIDPTNTNQYVVWAVGGLGETAFRHFIRATSSDSPVHLGRTPEDQCDGVELVCQSCSPFVNEQFIAGDNGTIFDVTIGPSGNERGYMGITGRAGWGIAFYINGTLIPELTVERGKTYTFLIHGGKDPNDISNYHPLYITDSISGGRLKNTQEEKANETLFAGFDKSGEVTAVGDFCQLVETPSSENIRESCSSDLTAYLDTLTTSQSCASGQPGKLVWTPDDTTPDLVYYQCATHLNLGWKINVVDSNDSVIVEPPTVTQTNDADNDTYNCILFNEELKLYWKIDYQQSSIRFKLCGCSVANSNQYMGFGLSGSSIGVQMQNADPTLVWVDERNGPQAVDYHLSDYQMCRDGVGACPDELDSSGTCTNDVFDIEGSVNDGVQCVSYSRNLSTTDSTCDKNIDPGNTNQYVIWAIGKMEETALYHTMRINHISTPIHLGRTPEDQCEDIDLICQSCSTFVNNKIVARESTTFSVTIGPSGGSRGYSGITGQKGSDVALYVEGTLIPELTVERGQTYTFLIYGGKNSSDPSKYHPVYITDSINGGNNNNETIFARLNSNDDAAISNVTWTPVEAAGDFCQFLETVSSAYTKESCSSLQAYIDTLVKSESCVSGQPARLVWTPDHTTPDLVYYQSATNSNMGWKINVLGSRMSPTDDSSNRTDDSSSSRLVGSTLLSALFVIVSILLFLL